MAQVKEKNVSETAENAAENLKQRAEQFGEQASEMLEDVCEKTNAMIKEYPYASLAVAFGAGLLFGLAVLRRD